MSHCTTCSDGFKEKARAIEDRRQQAQKLAYEQKKPQAICKDEVNDTFFIAPADEAIANHYFIHEVVSGLPVGT